MCVQLPPLLNLMMYNMTQYGTLACIHLSVQAMHSDCYFTCINKLDLGGGGKVLEFDLGNWELTRLVSINAQQKVIA